MAMKVVQIMGYLFAEIFQRFMFLDIGMSHLHLSQRFQSSLQAQ